MNSDQRDASGERGALGERGTQGERLNKYLARCGVASRRASDQLIAEGHVRVNGAVVTEMGLRIDPERDRVSVDGRPVHPAEALAYYLLYKPVGYVSSAADPHAERIAQSLVPEEPRLFSVGRLDADSEGLLLYTNDGDITLRLTHPSYEHPKEYLALVRGEAAPDLRERFARGIDLADDKMRAQGKLTPLPGSYSFRGHYAPPGCQWFRLIAREGRKRLVRRMFAAMGLEVERLIRVRLGPLKLGTLEPGQGRWLTPPEARALQRYCREEHG